jgi:hypothetical protein
VIKNFISNALLSVVMDKDARKKLQDLRSNKPAGAAPGKEAVSEKSATSRIKPLADDASGEDVMETIAQALAEARADISGPKRPMPGSQVPMPSSPHQPSPPAAPHRRPPATTPERERLIQQAIEIHREKAHVLENLSPALREKLMVMAMYAMDPSSLPPDIRRKARADTEAEGLVDDIGTRPGKPGKKPLPSRR